MIFDVYMDGHPKTHWMGHALEEVGCIWLAGSPEEAAAMAPQAIARYLQWLHRHGEPGRSPHQAEGIAVSLKEVQEVPRLGISGAAVGFFKPDEIPVTDSDIALAIRRLGYARLDLLETVSLLPPAALDWQPPGNKRSISQNLLHIRNAQFFYLHRLMTREELDTLLPQPWPAGLFESLQWTLARVREILPELPQTRRAGVFPAAEPRENWTARKMLRRFVEHELEHLQVVRQTADLWRKALGWRLGGN